jgi:hypothetical protein
MLLRIAALLLVWFCLALPTAAGGLPCGMSISDWCPPPPGDPCGAHNDADACRNDSRCYGIGYSGESVIACMFDARGFASNCPTVGCTSTPPRGR